MAVVPSDVQHCKPSGESLDAWAAEEALTTNWAQWSVFRHLSAKHLDIRLRNRPKLGHRRGTFCFSAFCRPNSSLKHKINIHVLCRVLTNDELLFFKNHVTATRLGRL